MPQLQALEHNPSVFLNFHTLPPQAQYEGVRPPHDLAVWDSGGQRSFERWSPRSFLTSEPCGGHNIAHLVVMIAEQRTSSCRTLSTASGSDGSRKDLLKSAGSPQRHSRAVRADHHSVQGLSDYIRVFCQESKGRFLLQDIEQLLRDPVFIRQAQHDPAQQERCHLVDALLSYFKANRTNPLYWFDVITGWKGGHAVMTLEEFIVGFQRYCQEIHRPQWQEDNLQKVFSHMLRSQGISSGSRVLGRQDFRFAMKRSSLSHRKVLWLNAQASILKQIQRFLHSIRAQFSDFCPAQVLRQQGKTITLHELESMLYKLLADLDTFHACPHAKEMAAKHSKKVDAWRRRDGLVSQGSSGTTDDGSWSWDEDDCGSIGSVGSLLRQEKFRGNPTGDVSLRPLQFTRKASATSLFCAAKEQSYRNMIALPSTRNLRTANQLKERRGRKAVDSSDDDSMSSGSADSTPRPRRSVAEEENELRKLAEQKCKDEEALKLRNERMEHQRHITQYLQPEEMQYLHKMIGAMGLNRPAAGQTRRSIRISGALTAETGHGRSERLVQRHSIIYAAAAPVAEEDVEEGEGDDDDLQDSNLDSFFQDELASFEESLSKKKAKHLKAYSGVTQQFERKVNLARTRLHQIHR